MINKLKRDAFNFFRSYYDIDTDLYTSKNIESAVNAKKLLHAKLSRMDGYDPERQCVHRLVAWEKPMRNEDFEQVLDRLIRGTCYGLYYCDTSLLIRAITDLDKILDVLTIYTIVYIFSEQYLSEGVDKITISGDILIQPTFEVMEWKKTGIKWEKILLNIINDIKEKHKAVNKADFYSIMIKYNRIQDGMKKSTLLKIAFEALERLEPKIKEESYYLTNFYYGVNARIVTWNDFKNASFELACDNTKMINTIISVNPLDFYTMSHGNSWTSCHSIRDEGCHLAGCLTLANDETSILVYTLTDNDYNKAIRTNDDFYNYNKLSRWTAHISDSAIIINQGYPHKTLYGLETVKEILKPFLSDDFKSCSIDDIDIYSRDNLGYPDWRNTNNMLTLSTEDPKIVIGKKAYFINDDAFLKDFELIFRRGERCYECGDFIDEDDETLTYIHNIDGCVCSSCYTELDCYYCRYHERHFSEQYHRGESFIDIYGHQYNIDTPHFHCDNCNGIITDCGYESISYNDLIFCCIRCLDRYLKDNEEKKEDDN